VAGRNTQGVHLIRLNTGDSIAAVAAVVAEEEEEKQLAEKEKNGANNKPPAPDTSSIGDKEEIGQENMFSQKPDKTEKKKPILPKKTAKRKSGKKKK